MDIDKLIKLMQEFSNSNLASLKYEEGNIRIRLNNKTDRIRSKNENPLDGVSNYQDTTEAIDQERNKLSGQNLVDSNLGKVKGNLAETDTLVEKDSSLQEANNENGRLGNKEMLLIKSPTVGTFYKAASPDSEPYIQVGDIIEKGQVVGIVEAMKVMNEIESPYRALVKEIPVDDEELVEFGQTLVVLEAL